jgi:CheY-like chemotaxis protein
MATILIVDDDADTREILRIALEDDGHTVLEAGSANLALTLMRTSPVPLVVLLDLYLCGYGDDTPVIKAMEADPSLALAHRVIVLTAGLGERAAEAMRPVWPTLAGFLTKPFNLSEVRRSVARVAPTGNAVVPEAIRRAVAPDVSIA